MKFTKANMKLFIEADHDKEDPGQIIVPVGSAERGILYEDFSDVTGMLVSGTTGSGKTSFIRSLISEIMMKYTPEEVKFVIYDSRGVDYSVFEQTPYLLTPVITDSKKALMATDYFIIESKTRIENYRTIDQNPHLILIMDDYGELSLSNKEITDKLIQLSLVSRKIRIHNWIVTSTPLDKVLSPKIKNGQILRVSFHTTTEAISRSVIYNKGAEKLRTPGEMIFMLCSDPVRCDAMYIDEKQVLEICEEISGKLSSKYETFNPSLFRKTEESQDNITNHNGDAYKNARDELFEEAAKCVVEKNKASIGMIQRIFKIGFNRASHIMDQLAEAGIVGEEEGTKPRKVLMTTEMLEEYLGSAFDGG